MSSLLGTGPKFLNLPEDAWRSIAVHLATTDILSFLSVHRNITQHLSNSASFWEQLLARDRGEYESNINVTKSCCEDARQEFMLQAYKQALPVVKWIPLNIQNTFPVSAREGHLSCVLDGLENYKTLVITGGFTDDDGVTVIELPSGIKSGEHTWGWTRLTPIVRSSLVYGASLTALPPVDSGSKNVNIAKAVRFGGFEGGGR